MSKDRAFWRALHTIIWAIIAVVSTWLAWDAVFGDRHPDALAWVLTGVIAYVCWHENRRHLAYDEWERKCAELGPRRSAMWQPEDEDDER
jgi:hypothetical protein